MSISLMPNRQKPNPSVSIRDTDILATRLGLQEIATDNHAVLQILVNLIRNAGYACEESDRLDKRITVRTANGDSKIRISVTDNGVGIAPENLARIFNLGFTTRKGGHGFGLHSGALAAKELGGALRVHSEGVGLGAIFTLELPLPKTKYYVSTESPG